MKKYGVFLGVLLILFSAVASYGMVEVVVFDDEFVRGTGEPVTVSRTFPGISGPANIKLTNVGGQDSETERVSSSTVTVNGIGVFGPSNFNQNVGYLEAIVTLNEGDNTLEVLLKSKPGGKIRIEIVHEVDADGAAFVGPEGGTIQTDAGYSIDIPAGALTEDVIISLTELSEAELPLPLPPDVYSLGAVDIKPDGIIFNEPITLTIPITASFSPGTPFPLILFNPSTNEYEFETNAVVNPDGNSVSAQINHTSIREVLHRFTDGDEQRRLKDAIVERISAFLTQYEGRCFYDEELLKLGDIDLVKNRLYENDVEIYIENDFLDCIGAQALYCHHLVARYKGCTVPGLILFHDIVIKDEPSRVDAETLYHEVMHAIFGKHRKELKQKGVSNDEAITYYLDHAAGFEGGAGHIARLTQVEDELDKGSGCDSDRIEQYLDRFVSVARYDLDHPFDQDVPLDPISDEALNLVRDLTGFYVHPEQIRERYEAGECGVCEPQIEVSVGSHSSHFSSGYYIQLHAEDPNHIADSITVTGPGIATSLALTYEAEHPGEWWSVPNVYLGQTPPQPPLTYTFHIESGGIEYTRETVIQSFVHEFVTDLSPSGTASGDITFTWTGITLPGAQYQVQLSDDWNRIWDSPKTSSSSIAYTGPSLSPGATYHYDVAASGLYGNESLAGEQFVYLEEDIIIFEMEGVVTEVQDNTTSNALDNLFQPGDRFSGRFFYDVVNMMEGSSTVYDCPTPTSCGIAITINGLTFSNDPDNRGVYFEVTNDSPPDVYDRFLGATYGPVLFPVPAGTSSISMIFYDGTGTALSSESLPTEFELSSWETASINIYSMFFGDPGEIYNILMDIESITRVQ